MSRRPKDQESMFRIPGHIRGNRNLSAWLQGIGIRASEHAVRRVRRERKIRVRALPGNSKIFIYESDSIRQMIFYMTGVKAEFWLASREGEVGMGVQIQDGSPKSTHESPRVRVVELTPRQSVILNHADGASRKLFAVITTLPASENQQETLLLDPITGKPYMTRVRATAEQWDLDWWDRPWRIVQYSTVMNAVSPAALKANPIKSKSPKDRRANSLICCHHIDPETGRSVLVKVPAPMIGWADVEADTPCIFAASNIHRTPIAKYVDRVYAASSRWWWVWTKAQEVRPVTLDPVTPSMKFKRPQQGFAEVDMEVTPSQEDADELIREISEDGDAS